jgi:hypothetical protein
MARWGFAVMQPLHQRSPGFRVLAVAMHPTPTYRHFDPETLLLPIIGLGDYMTEVRWHRESVFLPPVRVYPGSITVSDRVNKQVSFYSYGGALHAMHEAGGYTLYVLVSTAPILSLGTQPNLSAEEQLACSTEALMARLRATALRHGIELAPRLAAYDPLTRYAGAITSMLQGYRRSPLLSHSYPDFFALLKQESAWLAAQPGVRLEPLEQLVGLGT